MAEKWKTVNCPEDRFVDIETETGLVFMAAGIYPVQNISDTPAFLVLADTNTPVDYDYNRGIILLKGQFYKYVPAGWKLQVRGGIISIHD